MCPCFPFCGSTSKLRPLPTPTHSLTYPPDLNLSSPSLHPLFTRVLRMAEQVEEGLGWVIYHLMGEWRVLAPETKCLNEEAMKGKRTASVERRRRIIQLRIHWGCKIAFDAHVVQDVVVWVVALGVGLAVGVGGHVGDLLLLTSISIPEEEDGDQNGLCDGGGEQRIKRKRDEDDEDGNRKRQNSENDDEGDENSETESVWDLGFDDTEDEDEDEDEGENRNEDENDEEDKRDERHRDSGVGIRINMS